jgi:hypothetical protein
MRKMMMAASGSLMLAACGGGSGGGTDGVPVVSGPAAAAPTPAPTPTPTPTPSATPTPTPVPTPTASYTRYTDLTGDGTFQTACASLVMGSGLPTPQPAESFGDSLVLGYTAASGSWSVTGDGGSLSFAGSEAVTAPAGQATYQHTTAGVTQQLTIAAPNASGTTLSYTRNLALSVTRSAGPTLSSCVFGVPSVPADVPGVPVSYSKVSVTGTAYMADANGVVQTYVLSASTGTARYDAAGNAVVVQVHLVGYLQTGTTLAATATDFGTYTGTGPVEAGKVRFGGSLDGTDYVSLFSSFAGAFFGGVESGAAFEILATDTKSGNRIAAVGSLAAAY